ncbi:MAG: hypothetical protein A2909_03280 [Candidatus Tagabacteria bacterium RIFCSPLOWO2_01_FULL_39_11]|uniref:Uncharacterized protein n=1 Tax=Candidatus Tagabacteria bacterium RIFCSPLOWO2_01_FULL_39_11 TaxID=1802295 RepID=A0A1G2LSV1_9BACT|nr:MAG: hypothetical protein A2909_03280 [Candidatus Tagabacteria bacterium RIFCSPLOWO2_01_FULL_39_11]
MSNKNFEASNSTKETEISSQGLDQKSREEEKKITDFVVQEARKFVSDLAMKEEELSRYNLSIKGTDSLRVDFLKGRMKSLLGDKGTLDYFDLKIAQDLLSDQEDVMKELKEIHKQYEEVSSERSSGANSLQRELAKKFNIYDKEIKGILTNFNIKPDKNGRAFEYTNDTLERRLNGITMDHDYLKQKLLKLQIQQSFEKK